MSTIPETLTFADDADEEHRRILLAKSAAGSGAWELGGRLLRFKETGDWRRVTGKGAPFEMWTDYLRRGVEVSVAQAFVYMHAATLPLNVTLRFGVQAASLLAKIVELTPTKETLEEMVDLELEGDDGKKKPYAKMEENERERALARLKAQFKEVSVPPERQQANALRDRLRNLAEPVLKAEQIQARVVGGHALIDLKAIPVKTAAEVFRVLAEKVK